MDINKNQKELIVHGIRKIMSSTYEQARKPTLSTDARNALKKHAKDLHEIIKIIKGKEFSIILKE